MLSWRGQTVLGRAWFMRCKGSLKKRKARPVLFCLQLCLCMQVLSVCEPIRSVAILHLSFSSNGDYSETNVGHWACHQVAVFHHPVANAGLTQDVFGIQHAFLRVNLNMKLDKYPLTSVSAALFWNALTCFAEKNSEEYCPFASKMRLKKQWVLAFVNTIIVWKAQSNAVSYSSLHIGYLRAWVWIHLHPSCTFINQNCMCDCIPALSDTVIPPHIFYWSNTEELKQHLLKPHCSLKNHFTCALSTFLL